MVSLINSVTFSIMSPETIKSLATVRIITSDLYDADGYPVEGGAMDPRMGVVDPGLHCRTCGGGIGDCPGHFGYLEMARPIIHVLYTKTIHTLLKITCRKCSRIMAKKGSNLKNIVKSPPQKCPHCDANQEKVTLEKPYSFYEGKGKTELNPVAIRERFEKIPEGDLKAAGFRGGRPEWLILTLFPVPPVTMRPSITLEGGERSEDDLTHKLVDIIRINQSLKENIDIGAPEFILNDLWELIQYHVSTYFDNELTGVPIARHRSGRPLKGVIQRLKAKEGRVRNNLLGKRVNFSARTVISPDPMISINEVGVPEVITKELTVAEYLTKMNMNSIKDLIMKGLVNYVIRPDGRRIKVTEENNKEIRDNIALGWTVERQLRDNDIVLFNRQPSLHRMSMMAHRVRVMPYQTFRISPQVCPPYNADFDGDEMNLHVPQTEEAKTEAAFLMEVQNNIISPKFGGPIIGLDLDQISGIYLLTRRGTALKKEEVLQILGNAGIDMDIPDRDELTGKEIFSMLLPRGLDITFKSSCCKKCDRCMREKCEHDAWVVVKNGAVKTGTIDKAAVGAFKGKLLSRMMRVSGNLFVKDFIDIAGRLGVAYLMHRGFSLGISDLDLPEKTNNVIRDEIKRAEDESDMLIEQYNSGELRILPGMTPENSLEAQILNVLASGLSRISDIVSENIRMNDIIVMVNSGSKGSLVNTTQMSSCVGQEAIMGQRIKRGYYNRTLPHFRRGDLSAKSHGFVARGFKQALTPFEVFWNIMNGREGLMDKSLRTRKSGYMQRRLVNALQDLKVMSDKTIRNSTGGLIQFLAGEDGINPAKSDWGTIEWRNSMEEKKPGGKVMPKPAKVGDMPGKLLRDISEYARERGISKSQEMELLEGVMKIYRCSVYDPEEAAGVVAAQSLSEPTTQMTMRTYHFAGTAGIQVTLGLPRLLEIFDARKEPKTPTMTINLEKDHQSPEKAKRVAENIKEVKLRDVILSDVLDLTNLEIRCKLDALKLARLEIPENTLPKNIKLRNINVKTEGNELVASSRSMDLKNLRKLKYRLLETHIKGIKGISQAVVNKEGDEWVINTLGSNLKRVFEINGVDAARTSSNNLFEILDVLGIEAARNAIIRHSMYTIEEQGLGVDIRYTMLLADLMTVMGNVRAIGRYGVAGQKASVLARAAFEETKNHLIRAAIRGERDEFNGIVENIMVNQVIPIGTGAYHLRGWIPEKGK